VRGRSREESLDLQNPGGRGKNAHNPSLKTGKVRYPAPKGERVVGKLPGEDRNENLNHDRLERFKMKGGVR